MSTVQKSGLRDRKRQETRARLEEAAVTLVLRDGLEHTTIDAISELADVSPRTFFNYFDSKDGAILGLRHLEAGDESVSASLADLEGNGPVDDVVHLLFAVMGAPLLRPTIREERKEIVRRYPQVLSSQLAQVTQMTSQLSDAVQKLLATQSKFAGQNRADRAASADLILAMCIGAIRLAVKEWAQAGRKADDTELEQRAISLVRDLVEKLT